MLILFVDYNYHGPLQTIHYVFYVIFISDHDCMPTFRILQYLLFLQLPQIPQVLLLPILLSFRPDGQYRNTHLGHPTITVSTYLQSLQTLLLLIFMLSWHI